MFTLGLTVVEGVAGCARPAAPPVTSPTARRPFGTEVTPCTTTATLSPSLAHSPLLRSVAARAESAGTPTGSRPTSRWPGSGRGAGPSTRTRSARTTARGATAGISRRSRGGVPRRSPGPARARTPTSRRERSPDGTHEGSGADTERSDVRRPAVEALRAADATCLPASARAHRHKRMKTPRGRPAATLEQQVEAIARRARSAGVGSSAPDVPRLRSAAAELIQIHRRLRRSGAYPDLQRHIAALHRLISEVCDAHAPPAAPMDVPPPRRPHPTTTDQEPVRVDHRTTYQRFPEESGDSVQTVGGGLPGLGRRR